MTALEDFILVKTNGQKEGKELAEKYAVSGYPTFTVVNAKGTTLETWAGYGKSHFLARASAAVADLTTIEEKLARYEANPSGKDAAVLGRYHDARGEYADAIGYYQSAEDMNDDPNTSYLMPMFETTYYGHRKEVLTFDQLKTRADNLFASKAIADGDVILATRMMLSASRREEATDAVLPYLEKAVARTESSTDEEVKNGRSVIMPDYAMLVLKDSEKAVEYKRAAMKEGWQEAPDALNSFAWWCFENNVNLEEAQAMAMKGVELAETGGEKAQILDTAAEICNARDDCATALTLIQQAIKEHPESEYYKKQEKRFQELLAQKNGNH